MLKDKSEVSKYEEKYGLPTVDIKNGSASRLLKVIIDHIGELKK